MELQKYFSMWWDSRTENPLLFYNVIILTLTLLGLIIWLVKVQKRYNKRRKLSDQQTAEVTRPKDSILNDPKLKVDEQTVIQQKVEENKSKSSNEQQSDKPVNTIVQITTTQIVEKPKPVVATKKVDKVPETKSEIPKPVITIPVPKVEIIKAEKEEQSKEKYIGYNPINVFAQTEPLNYPYVIMPKANCVIKFPRKGRVGRKGFKEENFKVFVEKYFRNEFQIFDDRFIIVKNSNKPYEPDFTLIDEKSGINIFLDIEIDEPYEGLNDIAKRKATHFQYADTNRNNAFASRGWIIIRFAEIQVHRDPNACCNFVADVIKSINPKFLTPTDLSGLGHLKPVRQWTKEEAEEWSLQKYREEYLGITNFGVTSENQIIEEFEETELGEKIEEKVIEVPKIILPVVPKEKPANPKLNLIKKSIKSNEFLSFTYQGNQTITKPIRATETQLTAFCYVKNLERTFIINEISNLHLKSNYNTLRIAGPTIGVDKISNAVNTAIKYNRLLRIKYTKPPWFRYHRDIETGELILDKKEAEISIRTIMNVQLLKNSEAAKDLWFTPNEKHIIAYCNKREEDRMFRFDRISEIEILDI
jgi:hypothetical protein